MGFGNSVVFYIRLRVNYRIWVDGDDDVDFLCNWAWQSLKNYIISLEVWKMIHEHVISH